MHTEVKAKVHVLRIIQYESSVREGNLDLFTFAIYHVRSLPYYFLNICSYLHGRYFSPHFIPEKLQHKMENKFCPALQGR